MGLPLRNSTSFMSPNPGGPSLGGPRASTPSDSESDPDLLEPLSHRYPGRRRNNHPSRFHQLATLHHNSKAGLDLSPRFQSKPDHHDDYNNNNNNNNTTAATRQHIHHHHTNQRRRLHRHRLRQAQQSSQKPRGSWGADAAEGYTIARSSIQLPGEGGSSSGSRGGGRSISRSRSTRGGHGGDGSTSSSSSSSAAGRRPPSLERQDAFRDEQTAKKRRRGRQQHRGQQLRWEEDEQEHDSNARDEQAEVAELYRMGLLYDDEHERGEGFSLGGIVRDEPAYSLWVRPAKRSRRAERRGAISLSAVDLAFSAFGADEALAGWMLSNTGSGSGSTSSDAPAREEHRSWMEIAHDTPRLTVVYELADDAVSAMSVDDDLLDTISVSEISFCGGDEGSEMAWAVLDGNDGNATSATMDSVEADEDVDPWVVLGQDGS